MRCERWRHRLNRAYLTVPTRLRWTFIVAVFVCGSLSLVGPRLYANAALAATPAPSSSPAGAQAITAAMVEVRLWPRFIETTGPIAAWDEASIGALVGGLRIAEVRVDVGDVVRRGQILARSNSESLSADEAGLRADLELAQFVLKRAQAESTRAQSLRGGGAISDQDASAYLTQAGVAQAQADAAEAKLSAKRLQIRQSAIVAPDDGVISARSASVGAVTGVGQELFRLIRRQRLEWRGEVTAAQVVDASIGQEVLLLLPNGSAAKGRVRAIAPNINPQTRLGTVYADLEVRGLARPGMFATARIELSARPANVVPAESLILRDGRSLVAKLGPEIGTVILQPVAVGRRLGNDVEIISGLTPHDRVVVHGASFLGDGDRVRVIGAADAQSSGNKR